MSTLQNDQRASTPARLDGPPASRRVAVREQFIPLRKAELVDALASSSDLSANESRQFRRFSRLWQAVLHCEYQASLEELKNAYAPFDPDADTRSAGNLSPAELADRQNALFERFTWLLERGNFVRLAEQEIQRALDDSTHWGLNLTIDLSIFERLEIFCRGDEVGTRFRRRLVNWMRPEAVEVPIYQRLVVIFRLRADRKLSKYLDTEDVHIKLFKDIPQLDLEMLLPGTVVKMSMLDRAKILLPTLSGVSITIWKLVQGVIFAAAVGVYGFLALLGLVGGTIGYGLRSFFGYLNTKQKYQLNLTQSLYYQNLDNNAGAIYRLLDEAEEQDNREALLAYYHLWRSTAPAGVTADELDRTVETYLQAQARKDVDFEIHDALAKLARVGLVTTTSEGLWKALPIDQALEALGRHWISLPE